MKLITERLILRDLTMKDAKDLVENINDLKVSRYLAVVPYPYSIKDAKWYINKCLEGSKKKKKDSWGFGIELKSEKKIIGGIGLAGIDYQHKKAEIGYWLGKDFWRQGIMSEAANELIKFAFQKLKLRRIELPAYVQNKASNSLAKKLGFKLEGTLRKHHKTKSTGKIHDANVYGLLREEWKNTQR